MRLFLLDEVDKTSRNAPRSTTLPSNSSLTFASAGKNAAQSRCMNVTNVAVGQA
jgi:hypothetical protein